MSSTTLVEAILPQARRGLLAGVLCCVTAVCQAAPNAQDRPTIRSAQATSDTLSDRQRAIVPIAAFTASGEMHKLGTALNQGLDVGLTVSDVKEVLVQVYAYAGFPRSLNALGEFMAVLDERRQCGIEDAPGRRPGKAIPQGDALLAAGASNQTRLLGGPAEGPLFDFAPAIDEYLKTHLFGDIFERDNLDWKSREIATVSMLSVLPGAESQLQAHMRISMNVGITADQLRQLAEVLADHAESEPAHRARQALSNATRATGAN